METAVALIIFNRPDSTKRVFAEIARARPPKLFVVADGPREGRPGDVEKCAETRALTERVDWDCEVFRNYADANLGCGRRPATGISWVFEHVEEAIILEDDCVPEPSFFPFCEEMLGKYRNDERIMKIGGRNDLSGKRPVPYSYFFWRRGSCWGWATWRRAWKYFDYEIKLWPELRETPWLLDMLGNPVEVEHWRGIFDRTYAAPGDLDYWDFQWAFSYWAQSGLAIAPSKNLIHYIGFGEDATHTNKRKEDSLSVSGLDFPLRHPPYVVRDLEAERLYQESFILPRLIGETPGSRLRKSIKNIDKRCFNGNFKKIKNLMGDWSLK